VGVPADMLRRRPDVRAAEFAAMAQCAKIGVAKADLFPSFSLFGSIGFLASDVGAFRLSDLLTQQGFMAQFSPQVSWNLFNYGRIINNVRVQDAKLEALLITYQQTVLTALREVEDALAGFIGASGQVVSLAKAAEAAKRSVDLAFIQYSEGKTDYTTVLVAQQELLKQQNDLVSTQGSVAINLILLYRALGGGWEVRQACRTCPRKCSRKCASGPGGAGKCRKIRKRSPIPRSVTFFGTRRIFSFEARAPPTAARLRVTDGWDVGPRPQASGNT
jgi:outer membrane protein TolC